LGGHKFNTQPIWAKGEAPDRGEFIDMDLREGNVICNGLDSPAWYRAANVFDHKTVEWPFNRKPPINGVVRVEKVLSTNCNCHTPYVWRGGRMGTFTKGVLSHSAYVNAKNALEMFA
jgi:hypothetical protein